MYTPEISSIFQQFLYQQNDRISGIQVHVHLSNVKRYETKNGKCQYIKKKSSLQYRPLIIYTQSTL